jgi:3-methyladenine DNA glycosylase/8-oxoguanine DNA glycosylase
VEDATEKRGDREKIKNSTMQDQEIQATIRILKKEVPKWRVPVIGHYTESPFTVLISCLLSLRTQDKTIDAASDRLFQLARTPQAMAKLPTSVIERTIYPVGFYKTKAKNIKKFCRRLLSKANRRVPDDIDVLLSLPSVGRKTANLVVTLKGKKGQIFDFDKIICNKKNVNFKDLTLISPLLISLHSEIINIIYLINPSTSKLFIVYRCYPVFDF